MTDTDDYIRGAYQARTNQYRDLFATSERAWEQNDDKQEDADRAIDESILGVEQTKGFEVTISTGGPGEWLECWVDQDDDTLTAVTFVAAWWSEPRRTRVMEGEPLWLLADRMNPWGYR